MNTIPEVIHMAAGVAACPQQTQTQLTELASSQPVLCLLGSQITLSLSLRLNEVNQDENLTLL